ncbi:MAG TPA: autotransporter domain-containing protein [Candidatus Deferrimicrobiaceae bacterium]
MRLNKLGLWIGVAAVSVLCATGSSMPASAEEDFLSQSGNDSPVSVSNQAWGRLEYFNWREYDGKLSRAKESGPRLSVGVARSYNRDDITFTPRVGAMVGYVGNEGTLGYAPNRYIDTYAKYLGFDVGADVGVVYHLQGESTVEPFLGLGWNWWRRDIASWGGPRETWDTIYARGGARASANLVAGQKPFRGYGELGLRMPLSTQDSVKLAGQGKVNLKPRGALSAFAEAGVVIDRWRFGVSYDSWRFMNSDPVALPDATPVAQRKSAADIYSLNAGYSF